jgi:RNA polymerase sporulation-specific sigma factor
MEETIRLLKAAHEGDTQARDALVMNNIGLVWSIVRHFNGRGQDPEDLYQIGCIGLIKAIDKFDLEYDVKFSTYAVPMIMGEVKRFLRDDGMIKVSRGLKELGMKVKRMRESMTWELGREPTVGEIAGRLGVSPEEAAASLDAAVEVESIYQPVGSGDDQNLTIGDRLADERQEQEQLIDRIVLSQVMNQLDEREREIIYRRYFENQTQSRIAADFHISQVQVSRLEKKILLRMREYLKGNEAY